jgi:O-antigen ligase
VFLVSGYAILEFIDRNITGLGVTSFVKFPADLATESYRPLFLVFIRARGFMGESAMLALFLNTFVPMSFVYLRRTLGTTWAVLFVLVAVVASALTFSVAALAFIALGLTVALVLYVYDRGLAFVPLRWTVAMAGVALVVGLVAAELPSQVWQIVADKLTLVNDPASGYDRLRHWSDALPVAVRHPVFGTGIGSTSAELGGGVISFYLTMLKEAGIPSLLLILAFFTLVFREITKLPRRDPYKYAYAVSFVAAVSHYAIISDIWYPWFWLLCIFVVAQRRGALVAAQPAPQGVADAAAGVP